VQLLEAASVLLQMNLDNGSGSAPAAQEDEQSTASPAASGSSDLIEDDDLSSRTSTPSQDDTSKPTGIRGRGRLDSYSESLARSYQSTSAYGVSAPNDAQGATMYRPWTNSSNGQDLSDDEAVAANRFVNASFGAPKFGAGQLPPGVPPVPQLPAKYMRHEASSDIEMIDEEDDEGVFGHMEQ